MIKLPFSLGSAKRGLKFVAPAEADAQPSALAQADAARDRNDWEVAATLYAEAVADEPSKTELLVQLGHSQKEFGRYEQAETAYRKYLGLNPEDIDIHVQLGHLFNRMGEANKALDWYKKALKLAPKDVEIARHVDLARNNMTRHGVDSERAEAMRLVDAGQWGEARAALRELVVKNGQIDMIAVYANVTKEDGDFEEARTLYGQYRAYANEFNRGSLEDVEVQLGHLHKIAGDYRTALSHYIAARNRQFETAGFVDTTSPHEREIQGCINEIYTCFAQPG